MRGRRKQFTIKTGKMSDEVYEFFEQLSSQGNFTKFVIQAGEDELEKQSKGSTDEVQPLARILDELLQIKTIVQSRSISLLVANKEREISNDEEIVKLSSDRKLSSLESENIDYDF